MVRAVAHHHVAGAVLRERYLRPLGVSGCAVPGEARQLLLRVLGLRHRRAFGLGVLRHLALLQLDGGRLPAALRMKMVVAGEVVVTRRILADDSPAVVRGCADLTVRARGGAVRQLASSWSTRSRRTAR